MNYNLINMKSGMLLFFYIISFYLFSGFSIQLSDSLQSNIDSLIVTDSLSFSDSLSVIDSTIFVDSTEISVAEDSVLKNKPETQPLIFPVVENKAFSIGEKLTFKIRYGFIRAGTATMSVKKLMEMNGRQVYHIQTTAESAAGFSWIYKVEDVVDSYVDKQGLFSWKFEKKIREGGYKADMLVDYDPFKAIADVTFTRFRNKKVEQKNYIINTPPFSLDVLAAFYFVRTQELKPGESIYITNHDNKKVYELEVRVYKKVKLEVEAGEFNCLYIEPLLKGEGIFKQKGKLRIWMTDDQYKIPIQMTSEVIVGHITTELEKIEGLPKKLPSLISKND